MRADGTNTRMPIMGSGISQRAQRERIYLGESSGFGVESSGFGVGEWGTAEGIGCEDGRRRGAEDGVRKQRAEDDDEAPGPSSH